MFKIIGLAVLLAVVLVAGCVAIAGDEKDSLGRLVLVSHEQPRCNDSGDCYEQDYNNDYGNRGDNSQGRERGAFSPGPFDDSPVDAFNNACLPGATCYYERNPDERREPEQRSGR